MSNTEQISDIVINADGAALPKNLEESYIILRKNYNKVVATNKVQSNMLKEREDQLKANDSIIKSLEAKVVQQHEEIKDYKQNLLVMKQQIDRVLG